MTHFVEHNQSLKMQPGFIPNRDGPELKSLLRSKINT